MTFDPLISIFVLILFLCIGGSGRVRRLRRRRSSRAPTQKQLEYIRTLININNRYRAVPWSLEDWIEKYFKGNWDFSCASHLISKLKEENGVKSNEFAEKIKSAKSRQRECFFASDLGLYLYCPNTIFWIFKGYANKNLYEVNIGSLYHGDLKGRDGSAKENTNTSFLLKAEASLKRVEWYRLHESEPFYLKKYNLSGIPDGVGHHRDGSCSVIELKTRNSIADMKAPYPGDILQAYSYYLLLKESQQGRMKSVRDSGYC